jgi:hypothetical protein
VHWVSARARRTLFKEFIGKMATGVVEFLGELPPTTTKRPRAKPANSVEVPDSDSESEVSDEQSAAEVSAMEKRDKVTAIVFYIDRHDTHAHAHTHPHTHTHTHSHSHISDCCRVVGSGCGDPVPMVKR